MQYKLPSDLKIAESDMVGSVLEILSVSNISRISSYLLFEGLRIMPVVIRLSKTLTDNKISNYLIWPDAGATALAKRDNPSLNERIYSISDAIKSNKLLEDELLIAIAPQPYDYKEFEELCEVHKGKILMFNGKLEDPAVGIGSVARERRRIFISSWQNSYYLQPLSTGALMHKYPSNWELYKNSQNLYSFVAEYANKPDSEKIFEAIN